MAEDVQDSEEVATDDEPSRDASYKLETSNLSKEESNFASALGFGEDGAEPAENASEGPKAAKSSAADPAEALPDPVEVEPSSDADEKPEAPESLDEADAEVEAAAEEKAADSATHEDVEDKPAASPAASETEATDDEPAVAAASEGEWEEVSPRPAAEGIQSTLMDRADDVLDRSAGSAAAGSAHASPSAVPQSTEGQAVELARLEGALAAAHEELGARDREILTLRSEGEETGLSTAESLKRVEQLENEIESLSIEHDQLIDHFAATSGRLVQAEGRCETLETSLRAARGALIPLPEGERALRAEVVGLRGRLEESRRENVELAAGSAALATELSIATARAEDRQHEIAYHLDQVERLERELAQKDTDHEAAAVRQRETLALASRLQSENAESRSHQEALLETLEARDLEISAREEHLRVTREGLARRDGQLLDLEERIENLQRETIDLKGMHERAEMELAKRLAQVERRDQRIAQLSETLERIGVALGPTRGAAGAPSDTPLDPSSQPSEPPRLSSSRENASVARTSSQPIPPKPRTDNESRGGQALRGNALFVSPPALPPVLSHWRDRRLREAVGDSSIGSVAEFLAGQLTDHAGVATSETLLIRSLGGSLHDAEIHLANALGVRGFENVQIDVHDPDPDRAETRRQYIERAGMPDSIQVHEGNFEGLPKGSPCHGILLADALYIQPNIEDLLESLASAVDGGAIVLFAGRIGAGPIQLSASALARLEEVWEVLPPPLAEARGLGEAPFPGDDGGHPALSCDAGRALLSRFAPISLVGFGHLADLLVGPNRGFALSEHEAHGLELLDTLVALDESRGLTENLPPRHGVAAFAKQHAGPPNVSGQDWPEG